MTKQEAVDILADGHTMYDVSVAKEVLKTLGIKYTEKELPITTWKSRKEANPTKDFKGLWLNEDKPGKGVYSLNLSYFVAKKLGIEPPGYGFISRGFQAQANAEAVKRHLGI